MGRVCSSIGTEDHTPPALRLVSRAMRRTSILTGGSPQLCWTREAKTTPMRWRLQQEDSGWLSLLVSLLLGCSIDEVKGCEAVDCVLSTPPGFPTECIKCYTRCPVNDMYWTQDQPTKTVVWFELSGSSSSACHHGEFWRCPPRAHFSKNDKQVPL